MGEIITFYSYKGGVGRTMALANIAFLLAKWDYKILIVDWDLEAPGLEFYFQDYLNLEEASHAEGIIDLLYHGFNNTHDSAAKWQDLYLEIDLTEISASLHFLPAGKRDGDYFTKVRELDLQAFYSEMDGGFFIEALRNEWKNDYDYVLIDSRTGITDIGGVCTIQMPDIIVFFFTATKQSLNGIIDVFKKAKSARHKLPFDRLTLLCLPIPGRFDDKEERAISNNWLQHFSEELSEIYSYWLPNSIEKVNFLEITKIPYVPYFSFGEKNAVLEQGTISPQGLGYAYETLAALLANKLGNTKQLMENRSKYIENANRETYAPFQLKTIHINPFFYGVPVSHKNFIGRTKELRRAIGRLLKGESTAIVGDPHIGKTSFLNYLVSTETRNTLYGDKADQWYFSRIDSHMLGSQFTPAQFWEQVLSPIMEQIEKDSADISLVKHYKICHENRFGNFTLERLFSLFKKISCRFILLLDEFDALLHHPVLNSAEFYGGLRALASRSENAFTLIVASRASLSQLNNITQEFNPTGSPFFNIFSEITLGSFTDKDVTKLFSLAEDRFTNRDKYIIRTLAGKHPYLLQAACAVMWDAYEEQVYRPPYVTKRLYQELDMFFTDTWRVWTPEVRKAFTSVAIAHQARFMPQTGFLTNKFIKTLQDWGPELNDLEEKGLIEKNEQYSGGYRVSSEIMLTWLADELVKAGRSDRPFESWLQDKGIDGAFLSVSEKKVFEKVVRNVAGMLGQGAKTMIDAFAKQAGTGIGKKIF